MSPASRSLFGACLVAAVFCGGCAEDRERLQVEICGDLRLGVDVDAIRVTVLDEDRSLAYSGLDELVSADAGVPDAGACDGPFLRQVLQLPPGQGRAWVEVQTLRDGLQTATAAVRASGDAVVVALTQDCLGITCPLGQTCAKGACTLLPVDGDASSCRTACGP